MGAEPANASTRAVWPSWARRRFYVDGLGEPGLFFARLAICLAFVMIAYVGIWNAKWYPIPLGYDAQGDVNYAHVVLHDHRLPTATESNEYKQPPGLLRGRRHRGATRAQGVRLERGQALQPGVPRALLPRRRGVQPAVRSRHRADHPLAGTTGRPRPAVGVGGRRPLLRVLTGRREDGGDVPPRDAQHVPVRNRSLGDDPGARTSPPRRAPRGRDRVAARSRAARALRHPLHAGRHRPRARDRVRGPEDPEPTRVATGRGNRCRPRAGCRSADRGLPQPRRAAHAGHRHRDPSSELSDGRADPVGVRPPFDCGLQQALQAELHQPGASDHVHGDLGRLDRRDVVVALHRDADAGCADRDEGPELDRAAPDRARDRGAGCCCSSGRCAAGANCSPSRSCPSSPSPVISTARTSC